MSFWTDGTAEPKRNFRFLVTLSQTTPTGTTPADILWFAKTVSTPSFNVSSVSHDFLDNKYYYPGRVEWQTVSLTLVDPVSVDAVGMTNKLLSDSGYLVKTKDQSVVGSAKTISKKQATATGLGNLQIDILNAAGETIETWNLNNPFIEAAKYGDLDYSNDELRTVELTIKYDWASCTVGGSNGTSFFSI